MRNVKWNCFRVSAGTTVGLPGWASVSYGNGVMGRPLAWPLTNSLVPFVPFTFPGIPFVSLVPTPFLMVFPLREGAIVASCPFGGTR